MVMSLLVFNGSPRGKKSNSEVITRWFTQGEPKVTKRYLRKITQDDTRMEVAQNHEKFLFVFPLYVDGMPAQVKKFFEDMSNHREIFEGKQVTFIIHSGFSEAVHLKNLEKYLYRLTDIMGMTNYGVFLIPGSEGFRLMPEKMLKKRAEKVAAIGDTFRLNQPYDEEIKASLEGPLVLSKVRLAQFKLLKRMGLSNVYWNAQLKANNAYEKRFDSPYK